MAWGRMLVLFFVVSSLLGVSVCLPILTHMTWTLMFGTALLRLKSGIFHFTRLLLADAYFHGMGFLYGASEADVCAHLTNVSAEHWQRHSEDCTELLNRRFEGLVVVIGTLAVIVLCAWLAHATCRAILFSVRAGATGASAALVQQQQQRQYNTDGTPTRALIRRVLARLSPVRRRRALPQPTMAVVHECHDSDTE